MLAFGFQLPAHWGARSSKPITSTASIMPHLRELLDGMSDGTKAVTGALIG